MIDYSITMTDNDGDTISFSHDFDTPDSLMVEASGLVVSDDMTKVKTIMVVLNKAHIRALAMFLDMAYGNMLANGTEEEPDHD